MASVTSKSEIFAKVQEALVDALGVDDDEVKPEATLQGDLGAESIDFLDIGFRLESAFDIQIPDDEIWKGAFDRKDPGPAEIDAAVARLRAAMPEFRWDRFPKGVSKADLPRLITPSTILDYLERRLAA